MRPHFLLFLLSVCLVQVKGGSTAPPVSVPPPLSPKEVGGVSDDPGPGVSVDYRGRRITRRDPSGRLLWTLQLKDDIGAHREPHVLHDSERIYLSQGDGVTALDSKTGKIAWHSRGPTDRLYLTPSGKLLLAAECGSGDEFQTRGRWLVARSAATGKEVFKVGLPVKDFDPWPIREVAGLFLVQDGIGIGTKGRTFLIDQKGTVRHYFAREVHDGRRLGQDGVFLTSTNLVRVTADKDKEKEKEVWAIPFGRGDLLGDGRILDVAGGDLLIFRFGQISDSGVHVVRVDPRTGKKVWEAKCAPLGVSHSKYHHRASVVIDGNRVRVTSRGSFGSFVETLDLETGKQLDRQRSK
jgi:outer membrane protein assembly factor BamB